MKRILIPEFNLWSLIILTNKSPIRDEFFNRSVPVTESWRNKNSVLDVLFNESNVVSDLEYPDDLVYMYGRVNRKDLVDTNVQLRTTIYVGEIDFFSANSSYQPENIFNLTSENLTMIHLYRRWKTNRTTEYLDVDYSTLYSRFSKLIYLYIGWKTNKDRQNFITKFQSLPVAEDNPLHHLFEKYLVDTVYRDESKMSSSSYESLLYLNPSIQLPDLVGEFFTFKQCENEFLVTEDFISYPTIEINDDLVYDYSRMSILYDGKLLEYQNEFSVERIIEQNSASDIVTIKLTNLVVGMKLSLSWATMQPHGITNVP